MTGKKKSVAFTCTQNFWELDGSFGRKDIQEMKNKPEKKADADKRSQSVSVVLDSKLRYLAEIGARKHRRSLSSYIEWAIERSFKKDALQERRADPNINESTSFWLDQLWDAHESDRFFKLAFNYPGLLTNEELILWKLIRANKYLWAEFIFMLPDMVDRKWIESEEHFHYERLREHWDTFKAVARGEADMSLLPTVSTTDSNPEPLTKSMEGQIAKQKALSGQGDHATVISVRLSPKLRYFTELAARKQRRSVSNYIEWAVADSFLDVDLGGLPESANNPGSTTLADKSNYLWDVNEADRFVKLASDYPNLLTHEEQILWSIICTNKFLWREHEDSDRITPLTNYMSPDTYFIYERLREHWDTFKAVAKGEAELSVLPGRSQTGSAPEP